MFVDLKSLKAHIRYTTNVRGKDVQDDTGTGKGNPNQVLGLMGKQILICSLELGKVLSKVG